MLSDFFRLPTSADLKAHVTAPGFNWGAIISKASNEYVLPILGHRAKVIGIHDLLPVEIRTLLTVVQNSNGERNRWTLDEAVEVAKLLNAIGIQPVALKGLAYLLSGTYSDISHRYLSDIDLLLTENDLSSALPHLLKFGYVEDTNDIFANFRHHLPSLRRKDRPFIELHRQIGLGVCNRILPSSAIIAGAGKVVYQGAEFLIPSPSHLIVHLVLHSQLSHTYYDRIFPSLRSFVDLSHLFTHYGEQIDWDVVTHAFQFAGQAETLNLYLRYAQHLLNLTNPGSSLSSEARSFTVDIAATKLIRQLRWRRRLFLNRSPALRFLDPTYVFLALFSRRSRMVPKILKDPKSWPRLTRVLFDTKFLKRLLSS